MTSVPPGNCFPVGQKKIPTDYGEDFIKPLLPTMIPDSGLVVKMEEALSLVTGIQSKLRGRISANKQLTKDYVKSMHLIINNDVPDDFVVSTMVTHSVRDMVEYVFEKLDLDYTKYISLDQKFIRPEELDYLKGDSTKIRSQLGWEPEYTFETMLNEMIEFWLEYYGKK